MCLCVSYVFKRLLFRRPVYHPLPPPPPPPPQSHPYYHTCCLTYTVCCILERPSSAVHQNGKTTVRLACFTYTVHSVVEHMRVAQRSRVLRAINSPKPNFHNDCPGSTGLDNASHIIARVCIGTHIMRPHDSLMFTVGRATFLWLKLLQKINFAHKHFKSRVCVH